MRRFSTLAALAATDLGVGFLLQAFVLFSVGVSADTDAYFAGQAVPVVLLAILQLPLQRAVVVAFADGAHDKFPALRLMGAVALGACLVLCLVAIIAPWFIAKIYSELTEPAQSLAVDVLRAQCVAVLFSVSNLVLLSLNQVRGRFIQCEIAVVSSTLTSAAFVFAAVGTLGIMAAAYGQIVKAVVSSLSLAYMLRNSLSMGSPPWKEIAHVLRPLMSAGMLTKLAPVIDRSIASAAASGSMSLLAFGQSIYNAATGIAERAIVAPRLPALKRGASAISVTRVTGQLAAAGLLLAVVMFAAALVALQIPAVVNTVGREQLKLLASIMACLAGFPVAALAVQWIAAAVVILGRPDLSARIVAYGFFAGVAIKFTAFHIGGIRGLAIGISLYYLLNALAFLFAQRFVTASGTGAGI
jgi:peptidoglycan biosynthesis protein MviN/MurJ (putative lipid II flippase)